MFLEEGVCYSKDKFVCFSRCFLTSYSCIPVPCNEKDIFFGVLVLKGLVGLHRTIQLQLLQHYWLGYTWITVILNGLPWKQTEIILSFLRLHPSTAFWTLLLTMINSLSVASFAIIFSDSEGCLFTLLIVHFVVQKVLSLIRSHLFILAFTSITLGVGS